MRCALIVGHTQDAPGAANVARQLTEWEFNVSLAPLIRRAACTDVFVVHRGRPNAYGRLPREVNATGADFAVELHANAFEERPGQEEVSGTEVLYWHRSQRGKRFASILLAELVGVLGLESRGTKKAKGRFVGGKWKGDRGSYLLGLTLMPCTIAEPFFIDNDEDLTVALARRDELAAAYARAIDAYAGELRGRAV